MTGRRPFRAVAALALAFVLMVSATASAWSPFEKNHPQVEAGARAYDEGRYEDALAAFDAARRELPASPELWLNRGNALARLGRGEEAIAAFSNAAEAQDPGLRARALYNRGNVHAEAGKRDLAISDYRKSLRLNPGDDGARHNLEVLLRNLPPPPTPGADGGSDGGRDGGSDAGRPDAGRDAGADGGQGQDGGADGGGDGGQGGKRDAGQGDGGEGDGGAEDESREGEPDAGGSDGGSPNEQEEADLGPQDGGGLELELSEQEAEKLLDSMKQNEKNLQLWRFQKKRPRKSDGKDW